MDYNFLKKNSLQNEKFKIKSEKPVILKSNETKIEDKPDNKEKLKSLAYELKTLKEMMKLRNKNDYLCEAFFTCGLSNNNKILAESENSLASCRHRECSILPSLKPEILNCFPIKNQNFDISSTTASLCFPSGVKLCYLMEDIEKPSSYSHNRTSSFINIMTNEKGHKYYLYIFEYFKKLDINDYQKVYKTDTVREYMKLKSFINDPSGKQIELSVDNKNSDKTLTQNLISFFKRGKSKSDLEEAISQNLDICTQFIDKNYVYLPFKMCLVSKYSYSNQFEKCLEIILKMSLDDKINQEDINKLLIHLMFELPAPLPNKKILIYVPYKTNPIELSEYNKENPLSNYSLKSIIDFFSIENIIIIFNLILMEQKLIFVGTDYRIISDITQGFLNLMYPLFWINTYVPVLSEEMLKYLQSFMPYIMGVEESLMNKAKNFLDDETIFIISIDKNMIDLVTNKKGKKLDKKTILKNVPEIPFEIYQEVESELKILKSFYNENKLKIDLLKFDQTIKEIFVKAMVMMIGDYKKYVSFIDNLPLFNTDSFLLNRPSKYKIFYTELSQSQIFRQFLHNDYLNPRLTFENACKRYSIVINNIKRSSSKSSIKRVSSVNKMNIIDNSINNTTTITITPNLNTKKSFINLDSDTDSKISLENFDVREDSQKEEKSFLNNANLDYNENQNESISYLITPYFINETILKSDILKIEEILFEKFSNRVDKSDISPINFIIHSDSEKNKISNSLTKENMEVFGLTFNNHLLINNIYVINEDKKQKHFEFDKISENTFVKRYILPTESSNHNKNELGLKRRKYSFSFNNNNNLLNEEDNKSDTLSIKNKENVSFKKLVSIDRNRLNIPLPTKNNSKKIIKDSSLEINELLDNMINNINETLRMIFTSENLNSNNLNNMQKALNTRIGRSHFANILFQSKFKNMKNQILTENSFNNLYKLILIALIQSDDEINQYNDIRLITKSCFSYFKIDKKEEYYIYQEIAKKLINYKIWLNEEFWMFWFEKETNEIHNCFSKEDDYYFNILISLANDMSSLNISLNHILKIITKDMASKIFQDKELVKELVLSITKQYKNLNKS